MPRNMIPHDASRARWFEEQVQPQGAQLKSYLRGSFPSIEDVDDIVQESYLRIWKARAAQPIESARAFLFRVARNSESSVSQQPTPDSG